MYIPKSFEIKDKEQIFSFIKENAFGQLVSTHEGKIFSSHIPFLFDDEENVLLCHVAKPNPQWQDTEGQQVLVSLEGTHGYISPSWYKDVGVPTWNYQAVHINGTAKLVHDEDKLRGMLEALTDIYELQQEQPWKSIYNGKLIQAIVGISIDIEEVQCKFKLGQNRSDTDRLQVIEKLQKKGSIDLAKAMKDTL